MNEKQYIRKQILQDIDKPKKERVNQYKKLLGNNKQYKKTFITINKEIDKLRENGITDMFSIATYEEKLLKSLKFHSEDFKQVVKKLIPYEYELGFGYGEKGKRAIASLYELADISENITIVLAKLEYNLLALRELNEEWQKEKIQKAIIKNREFQKSLNENF